MYSAAVSLSICLLQTHLSLMMLMVLTPQAAATCITLSPTPLLAPFCITQSPVHILHQYIDAHTGINFVLLSFQKCSSFYVTIFSFAHNHAPYKVTNNIFVNLHETNIHVFNNRIHFALPSKYPLYMYMYTATFIMSYHLSRGGSRIL